MQIHRHCEADSSFRNIDIRRPVRCVCNGSVSNYRGILPITLFVLKAVSSLLSAFTMTCRDILPSAKCLRFEGLFLPEEALLVFTLNIPSVFS